LISASFFLLPLISMLDSAPPFEQAMERLEEIVSSMESDRMPLEDMVSSYEEGMTLIQHCRQRVDQARQRIEAIQLRSDGKAELVEFTSSTAEAMAAKAAPVPPAAEAESKTRRRTVPAAKPAAAAAEEDEIQLF
jgi:exodeoxyribonuclease VII small subunit